MYWKTVLVWVGRMWWAGWPVVAAMGAAAERETLAVSVSLATAGDHVFVRQAGDLEAGFTRKQATTSVNGQAVRVEMLSTLEYVKGSGPVGGYFTFQWERTDVLALRYKGEAFRNPDGGTTFDGTVEVLGGVGAYSRATGHGVVHGFRPGQVGGVGVYTLHIEVERPQGAPGDPVATASPGAPSPLSAVPPGFAVTLSGKADQCVEHEVGVFRDIRFGAQRLGGKADWNGVEVSVEWLDVFERRGGHGRSSGFLVVEAPDGSTLLCRAPAQLLPGDAGRVRVLGTLEVIRGTGRWSKAHGPGLLSGERSVDGRSPARLQVGLPSE